MLQGERFKLTAERVADGGDRVQQCPLIHDASCQQLQRGALVAVGGGAASKKQDDGEAEFHRFDQNHQRYRRVVILHAVALQFK